MPWTAEDATRHTKKANSPRKREVWARIANRELASGASEGSAVRQANSAVKRIGRRMRSPYSPITGRRRTR